MESYFSIQKGVGKVYPCLKVILFFVLSYLGGKLQLPAQVDVTVDVVSEIVEVKPYEIPVVPIPYLPYHIFIWSIILGAVSLSTIQIRPFLLGRNDHLYGISFFTVVLVFFRVARVYHSSWDDLA